jgi:1-phosphofructokinase family hexose kinase
VILAAGLTPALQQILVLESLVPGEVNRAREVHWCASGKVLNVARALHQLGAPGKALTLVGGSPGQAIQLDFARLGIPARWVEETAPTRVCTTILDSAGHTATELVPNAQEITDAEQSAFQDAYAAEAKNARFVVLIGSLPNGTPSGFYRNLLSRTPGKVILDARGPELLEALEMRPFLVKPNRQELQRTLGRDLRSEKDLFAAMSELNQRGAEWVVITDGANPVHACCREQLYCFEPPAREVVNPIGSGDCMAAGIAWALYQAKEPLEAIRFGLAVAADKVTRLLPGVIDLKQVEAIARSLEAIVLPH